MDARTRNNVKVIGQGKQTMMLVHGFGCDQNIWRYITAGLSANYQLVLIDQVGVGNSDLSAYEPDKYATLNGYAADIVEVCHTLGLQDVILVGHSVGAMISVLSAIQEPDLFSKLILIGPSPCYINDHDYFGGFERADIEAMLDMLNKDFRDWANTFAPLIMGNPECPSLAQELMESFCRADNAIAKEFARVTFLSDNRQDLPKVLTKTLILQCSSDMIAPAEVGAFVHQSIPDSRLITLRATGHCPHLSAPIETLAAIGNFLHNGSSVNSSSAVLGIA
ncbi:hydrolase [Hymenobacter qilianensis]|uniref:Hydrolase n=2 Tax=Hymenobacter qilianensis TaxID=1385715 RepID=A0ACB5PU80_9BACT|nr:alpha/beta hydrolase [Hymenobacter qilianensis]QNP51710.1 alpha/beta hydrolase [Hymenobacter qilianensis]GGF72619.1 hydrolase [Hymenobacter qilianensis]